MHEGSQTPDLLHIAKRFYDCGAVALVEDTIFNSQRFLVYVHVDFVTAVHWNLI